MDVDCRLRVHALVEMVLRQCLIRLYCNRVVLSGNIWQGTCEDEVVWLLLRLHLGKVADVADHLVLVRLVDTIVTIYRLGDADDSRVLIESVAVKP